MDNPAGTGPPGRIRQFRHAHAAELINSGVSIEVVRRRLGHACADTSAQARAGQGYARADFTVDYDTKTVTCPQGKTAQVLVTMHPARQGRDRDRHSDFDDDRGAGPSCR